MGIAMSLSRAAVALIGNTSPLAKWVQHVSQITDDVIAGDFVEAKNVGAENQVLSFGDTVILKHFIHQRGGVQYNEHTGIFTLQANKLYRLSAWGLLVNFSNAAEGICGMAWQIQGGGQLDTPGFWIPAANGTSNDASPQMCEAYYQPNGDSLPLNVYLKVIQLIGTVTVGANFAASAIEV